MISKKIVVPQDLYTAYLTIINTSNFTRREIDIMACLLSARGTSKIATFLLISPKTVVNHIHNIMKKAACNSREGIIDFIEKSNKISLLRQHYSQLVIMSAFEKSLKDISKLNRGEKPTCTLIRSLGSQVDQLKAHLELAGLSVRTQSQGREDFTIYVGTSPKTESETPGIRLVLSGTNEDQGQDYYLSVFEILQLILPKANLQKISSEFKKQYEQVNSSKENISFQSVREDVSEKKSYSLYATLSCLILFLLGGLYYYQNSETSQPIRSDLILPSDATLVYRPELLSQIDRGFQKQKDIQTVAIVGIGGAGKTTLARQYAKQSKGSVIWEINAETGGTLLRSFENLASSLAISEEDKKIVKKLHDIKDPNEKQEKIIHFAREKLRVHPNWLLIFDNVENFNDIQKYFPHDVAVWGTGRVILTTRNSTLQNNSPIHSIIQIGELDRQQKLNLFTQIIQQENRAAFNKQETEKLLTEIPSFPLDVSVAAYYLKATNTPFSKYLEMLNANEKEMSGLQESILKESGSYNKTRYKIITLSLQHLMKAHPDFPDLLLFIGLLDSQNIPKDLLDGYKDNLIVDNFIFNLKKYSLVSDGTLSLPKDPTLSIHRSTQNNILEHLTRSLSLEKKNEILESIAKRLEKYSSDRIEEENFSKMKLLVGHSEKFLTNTDLMKKENYILVGKELGWIYFYLGNYSRAIEVLERCQKIINSDQNLKNTSISTSVIHYLGVAYNEINDCEKARNLLNQSLALYKEQKGNNDIHVAQNLQHLGTIDLYKGNYESAKHLFEQSYHILTLYYPKNYIDIGKILVRLGNVNMELGNYKEALIILEHGLSIHKDHLEEDHYRVGQTLVRIGLVYRYIGEYKKAKESLEEGLTIYRKHFPDNIDKIAWVSGKLGQVENDLGNTKKAVDLLIKSSDIFVKNFPKDSEISWITLYLGKAYADSGDYKKAKISLEEGLLSLQKQSDQNHLEAASGIRELGRVYALQGDLNKGEELIRKSLAIYQQTNHPQAFVNLEYLAELYLKKSEQNENAERAERLKKEALSYLTQALDIVKTYFPEDSPHIERLNAKIASLR